MSRLPKPGTTRRSMIPPPASSASKPSRLSTIPVKKEPAASTQKTAHPSQIPHASGNAPPQQSTATLKPEPIEEQVEITSSQDDVRVQTLQAEVEDLRSKLDTLRKKRDEDKAKLIDLDRLRINYQNLVEFKTAALDEQRTLRDRLEETEARLVQAETRAAQMEQEMSNDLAEQLEMVTLDKLVAEQRAESLQDDLDRQKDKVLALESELVLLKSSVRNASMLEANQTAEEPSGNEIADGLHDVSVQIENYKNALIKMRDIVTTANFERAEMQQQYEQCREEYQRLQVENDKLVVEFGQVCDEIIGLHEQLDAAMGSTRMVEYLTEKNLELEDKLRTLSDDKEHLEELIQLTEEIAESARESQLDLRKECDDYIVRLSEKCNEVGQLENQIGQYDNIVQKFRQKTVDLNNEIVDYRDKIHILEDQLNQQYTDGSAKGAAIFSSTRNFADSINSELNSLELKFLNEYNKYLRIFLPDNFSKAGGDLDSILLVVFFLRISAKAELLSKLLDDRFPLVPDGMHRDHVVRSNKAEQWANVRKFHYYLRVLSAVAHRFETMTSNCTIESLTRLALQRTEITNQERHINQYFDLLKNGLFDENTSTDPLSRVSALLQRIFSVNVSATEYDTRKAFIDYLHQFIDGLRWIRFNCERIKFFVFPDELDSDADGFVRFVRELGSSAERLESQLLRAQKWIHADKMLDLSHDTLDSILNGFMLLEKIASILHDTNALVASRLVTHELDGFTTDELKELLQSVVEKREGHRTAKEAVDEVRSTMVALNSSIDEITNKLERRQFELPPMTERPNPLVERSQFQKKDDADAENLRWEITKKDESIANLAKALKSVEDNISFLKIQVEREKQKNSKQGRGDLGQAFVNAEQIQEALASEKQRHEEEMGLLRNRVAEMEKQLSEKETQVKRIVSKSAAAALFDPSSYSLDRAAVLADSDKGGDQTIPRITGFQQTPGEMLQSLHLAQERVRRLQAELDGRQLLSMRPLNVSTLGVYGPETFRLHNNPPGSSTGDHIELEYRYLLDESNILLLESKKLAAVPQSRRQTDSYRRQLSDYNKRAIDLRLRARAFGARNYPHLPLPKFGSARG